MGIEYDVGVVRVAAVNEDDVVECSVSVGVNIVCGAVIVVIDDIYLEVGIGESSALGEGMSDAANGTSSGS